MSLPTNDIPLRFYGVLVCAAALAWAMMRHAFRRQDRKRRR